MKFPDYRPRRLRQSENFRRMFRETSLSINDFIYPLFVVPGSQVKNEIPSMPGVFHFSLDVLSEEIRDIAGLGIPAVIFFWDTGVKGFNGYRSICRRWDYSTGY